MEKRSRDKMRYKKIISSDKKKANSIKSKTRDFKTIENKQSALKKANLGGETSESQSSDEYEKQKQRRFSKTTVKGSIEKTQFEERRSKKKTKTIYLKTVDKKNLNFSDISAFFEQFGNIVAIEIYPLQCFIRFSTVEEAKNAMFDQSPVFGDERVQKLWAFYDKESLSNLEKAERAIYLLSKSKERIRRHYLMLDHCDELVKNLQSASVPHVSACIQSVLTIKNTILEKIRLFCLEFPVKSEHSEDELREEKTLNQIISPCGPLEASLKAIERGSQLSTKRDQKLRLRRALEEAKVKRDTEQYFKRFKRSQNRIHNGNVFRDAKAVKMRQQTDCDLEEENEDEINLHQTSLDQSHGTDDAINNSQH